MYFKQFPPIDFRILLSLLLQKSINIMRTTFHKEHVVLHNNIDKHFVAIQAYLLNLECGQQDELK